MIRPGQCWAAALLAAALATAVAGEAWAQSKFTLGTTATKPGGGGGAQRVPGPRPTVPTPGPTFEPPPLHLPEMPPLPGLPGAVDAPGAPGSFDPVRTDRLPSEVLMIIATDGTAPDGAEYGLQQLEVTRLATAGVQVARYQLGPGVDLLALLTLLARDSRILAAQPNNVITLQAAPRPAPRGVEPPSPPVRRVAATDGVTVGLIDSAVDTTHPAVQGAALETADVIEDGAAAPGVHGTALAGIIVDAARAHDPDRVPRLLSIRAFKVDEKNPTGGISSSFLVGKAMDLAIARGVAVMNLSFAGPHDPLLELMVRQAAARGVVVVAAAGNQGPGAAPAYPAAFDQAIAVTATDSRDRLYASANRGTYISIAAPGVDLMVPAPGERYGLLSGTSLAAAYVSAAVAVLMQRAAALDPGGVRALIERTAVDLGPPGRDELFGAGKLDMAAAQHAQVTAAGGQ